MTHRFARRVGRRSSQSGEPTFQDILGLSSNRPIFTASGHITLSGTGDVLSIHDWNDDTHVFTQADTAKQCDPPAASAGYNDALVLTFTGAEYYDSNRAITLWPWTTDGTGFDFWGAANATHGGTRCLWSAGWNSGANGRGALYLNSTAWLWRVLSPGASFVYTCATSASETPSRLHCAYDETASPESRLQDNNLTLATATTTGAASAPTALTFRIGDLSSGSGRLIGAIRSLAFFPTLTTPQRDTMKQWIRQDTGIAA